MTSRRRAREVALQVLFQEDVNPSDTESDRRSFLHRRLKQQTLVTFSSSLIDGVRRNRDALDHRLSETAANWSLERMATTDRNVLRLGAYEMLYTETPHRVVINEAVELAKRFGSGQSAQFINGILDKFIEEC